MVIEYVETLLRLDSGWKDSMFEVLTMTDRLRLLDFLVFLYAFVICYGLICKCQGRTARICYSGYNY